MATDNKTIYYLDKYLKFILVVFCFVCVPAFILSYSVYRYFQTNEEQIISDLKTYSQHITNELRSKVDAERFFCSVFHEYYLKEIDNPDSNIEASVSFCKKFKEYFGDKIDFVVLTNEGEIKYNSNPKLYDHSQRVWYKAYHFAKFNYTLVPELLNNGECGDINALKEVFGQQTLYRNIKAFYDENIYTLMWGDSTGNIMPGAVYSLRWGGFFVFISKELLKDIVHLKYYIKEYSLNTNFTLGLYNYQDINKSFWTNKAINNELDVRRLLSNAEFKDKRLIEADKFYVYQQTLTNNYNLFIISYKDNTNINLILKALFVFFIYCVLSWHIINYFRNTIILNLPGDASIRLKIAVLFTFATLIPLLLFAVVSNEYEIYKRQALIKEARAWSTGNLLAIEQRYQSYLKAVTNYFDKSVSKWKNDLKASLLKIEHVKSICNDFYSYDIHDFFVIASESPYIGATEGIFKYYGPLDAIQFDLSQSVLNNEQKKVKPEELMDFLERWKFTDYRFLIIIVKKLMSSLAGKEISGPVMSKLEIIAEGFMQKPLPEIIYNFIEIEREGIIKEWGYGNRVFLAYLNFISIYDVSFPDYILVASWWPADLQKKFVDDIFTKLNRNTRGFKIIAFERYQRCFTPELYNGNKDLESLALRAVEKPTDELETINFNGETFIAVSVRGKGPDKYSFIGLYPMNNIDYEIGKQKSLLWLLGVLSLILSIGLAQLIAKSFIRPLLILQNGALAIENRNFKHRLSGLATDEFGEVGNIFNHAMVGLQELEIAKIVQESMFPKPEFKQGKFEIYGKSVTMIDVGGDYLDFFKVDDNSFSVLVGDVAGHGVGAAVIMAMAKAAVLNAGEALRSPSAVLNQLHKIILAAKSSKQKKIMTFQYLHVNSETGVSLYGNAGGCSPLLVKHSEASVQEIKMAAPVLGAFKKAVYKEIPLDIQPGDAIVFYTDGIVECKDKNGEMLGYDRLKKLILNCWDKNPEAYYNNIYKAYIDYVGKDADAGDDLTFVILMCS